MQLSIINLCCLLSMSISVVIHAHPFVLMPIVAIKKYVCQKIANFNHCQCCKFFSRADTLLAHLLFSIIICKTRARAGAFDAPTYYDHKLVKACCMGNTALDHTSSTVYPIQHREHCSNSYLIFITNKTCNK